MALLVDCPAAYRKKAIMLGRQESHPNQASESYFSIFLLKSLIRGLKITVSDDFRVQHKTYF